MFNFLWKDKIPEVFFYPKSVPIDVKAAPNLTIILTVAFVAIISYRNINNHISYTDIYQRLMDNNI